MAGNENLGYHNYTQENNQLPATPTQNHHQQPHFNMLQGTPQTIMNFQFGDPQFYPGSQVDYSETSRPPLQEIGYHTGNDILHPEPYSAPELDDIENLNFFTDIQNVAAAAVRDNANTKTKSKPDTKRDKSTPAKAVGAGREKRATKSKKGLGSKSGVLNRREAGGSDDEVELLEPEDIKEAGIVRNRSVWTDADKLIVVRYITSEKVWKDFKVKQAKEFIDVSLSTNIIKDFG